VTGWRGNKLITNKGNFLVHHIYGNWAIQEFRIFEIVTIQSDNNGSWRLNGIPYSKLEKIKLGMRFSNIITDENLRARKGNICAAAWLDTSHKWTRTVELVDAILNFWKVASSPVVEKKKISALDEQELSFLKIFGEVAGTFSAEMSAIQTYSQLFPTWSKPIWLTEFRPANQEKLITASEKILARTTAELQQTKEQLHKAEVAAHDTWKEATAKWMRFDLPGMSADTQARISKAVQMYSTDPELQSFRKIAKEFKVTPKTVSVWFETFRKETGIPVVRRRRHISVKAQLQTESASQGED